MKPLSFALVLAAAAMIVLACRRGVAQPPAPTAEPLAGHYVLAQRRSGIQPPEAFELKRDGSCIFDMPTKSGLAGTWRASPNGVFTMTLASRPGPMLTGRYRVRKYALQLFPGEPMEMFYVRWPLSPAKPTPPERELLGIQVGGSELGTVAQRMTADHRFERRERDLVQEDRTYYDVTTRGTFTYANGIINYRHDESTSPEKVDYDNDFVVSRDGKCLWIIVPALDRQLCVRRAMTLDLGPPPDGFHPGSP